MKKIILTTLVILTVALNVESLYSITKVTHWHGGSCQAIALTEDYALTGFGGFLYLIRLSDYQMLSTLELPNTINDIVINGHIAYVATRLSGIFVIDFSNPNQMKLLSNLSGYVQNLTLDGQRLYVAAFSLGVKVYDLAKPDQPVLLSSLDITPLVYDVAVAGNYIYCAGGSKGLTVIDQQNAAALKEVATLSGSSDLYYLCRYGNWLYASFETIGGLDIFNVSTPTAPVLQSTFSYNASFSEMKISGALLFAAAYANGLRILNLSDPVHPVEKEKQEIGAIARFAINKNFLAAADELAGLSFYRLQDSSISSTPSYFEIGNTPINMFACGSTLYLPLPDTVRQEEHDNYTRLYDLSDPTTPKDRGATTLYPIDCVSNGSYAYMIIENNLVVLDVTTTYQPKEIIRKGLKSTQDKLLIHNDRLYAFHADNGCDVVNISTPSSPVVQNMIAHSSSFTQMAGVGNALLALDSKKKLYRINISDPSNPVKESQPMLPGSIVGFWVRDQIGYVTNAKDTLSIYDLSDPFHPVLRGTLATALLSSQPIVYDHYGYFKVQNGLNVFDFTDPFAPVKKGFVEISGYFTYSVIVNNCLAVLKTVDEQRVILYNLDNPLHPTQLGVFAPMGRNLGLAIKDGVAFVANALGGLCGLDLSQTEKQQISELYTHGNVEDVAVQGHYAYVAVALDGLHIVDISDPANPKPVGHYIHPTQNGSMSDVVVKGDYACLIGGAYGIKLIDISKPENPVQVGSLDNLGWTCQEGAISNNLIYYCDGANGVKILDISDPANIKSVGSYNTAGFAYDICVRDSLAYVADGVSSLRVLNIANPSKPTEIGSYTIQNGNAIAVDVYSHYAIVAADWAGIRILDISNPLAIVEVDKFTTNNSAFNDVVASDGFIYACDENLGVFKLVSSVLTGIESENSAYPENFILSQNYPNPFNMSTFIHFSIPTPARVHLEIFNIMGQKIRSLIHEVKGPGEHVIRWDGKTDNGMNTASGAYIYRLQAGDIVEQRKMVLVK